MEGGKRKTRKTYAFTTDRSTKMSGWASDTRLYSTVQPRTVMSNVTNFSFRHHKLLDDPEVKGSYYASHVEPQALYDAREDAAILVTRGMCPECEKFVAYLASARNINIHVGTPKGIVTVSNDGSMKSTDSVSGTKSSIWWRMSHESARGLTRLQLIHPNRNKIQTDISVRSSGDPEGPIAVADHIHDDGITERSTYFENKEVDIQTLNIGGPQQRALTHVGTSGGIKDTLTYDDHTTKIERVPKNKFGLPGSRRS